MNGRYNRAAVPAFVLGLIGCVAGLLLDPKAMLASYLTAWIALAAIPLGAVGTLPMTYLVRAGWTSDLFRPLATAALLIPVAAILFLPMIAGMDTLYAWADPAEPLSHFQRIWFAPWFFTVRAVLYFAVLFGLALWLAVSFRDRDAMIRSASATSIVWALIISLAGIDWVESVEPHFHSSIYGLLILSHAWLAGLAFAIAVAFAYPLRISMRTGAYAQVLFSVLLLWAYLHAMQYIIIWTGNLPDETVWYLERMDGAWKFLLWALFILQFVVPFFILLSARMRENPAVLVTLALGTVALRYLESAILILPPLHVAHLVLLLDLPAALLLIGGVLVLAWGGSRRILARLGSRPALVR